MTKHEEVIEVGHSLIRRCHDLSDVLSAISVAARLVVEHLETTETALVEMIAFIEGRGHD